LKYESASSGKEDGVSIGEIRTLLIVEGERRRRLGRSALQSPPDDSSSRPDAPKLSDGEPEAFEED